jgi:GT2 family glycosyltransferase
MTTSVVIPVYGRWDLLHQLLNDLYRNCSLIEEIVIVNNGNEHNNPDVLNGLAWWRSTNMLPIEVLDIPENIGFLRASNIGIKHAVEDNVILISTDVRVHKDIVEFMKLSQPQYIVGGRLLDWNTGWNAIGDKIYPYLEGWILGASKEAWTTLGWFDEIYAPHDMEDVDFSTKAIFWDYHLSTFPEGYVSHLGAQSIKYGEEREAITKENRKKFIEKWTQINPK